jgi:hypothetical protein
VRYYWQNYFHNDSDNFAPRISFAYAPTAKSKTVIRGGAGIFYDRTGPSPIGDLLHFDGINLLRFLLDSPAHYPVEPGDLAGVPTSIVSPDPLRVYLRLVIQCWRERQITAKTTFSVGAVGNRGSMSSIDRCQCPVPGSVFRPNPTLGQVREMQSDGYLKGNALELTFRGKLNKYFSGQVQYTFSRTDNNTSGITFFPADSYNAAADWGRSDNDRFHKFDLLASTQAVKYLLGIALSLYSGKPVNT